MKTLKTTLLLIAILIANTAFSQTKEETLDWLNTNGSDLLGSQIYYENHSGYQRFENVDSDYVSFYEKKDWSPEVNGVNKFLLKSILFQDVNTVTKRISTEEADKAYFIIRLSDAEIVNSKGNNYKASSFFIWYEKDNEENAKRVIKAIMHLAKLSGAKENKQTF